MAPVGEHVSLACGEGIYVVQGTHVSLFLDTYVYLLFSAF